MGSPAYRCWVRHRRGTGRPRRPTTLRATTPGRHGAIRPNAPPGERSSPYASGQPNRGSCGHHQRRPLFRSPPHEWSAPIAGPPITPCMRVRHLVAVVLIAFASTAADATASTLIDRNASGATIKVNAAGQALVSYTARGKRWNVLAWGAVNAMAADGRERSRSTSGSTTRAGGARTGRTSGRPSGTRAARTPAHPSPGA